MEQHLDPVRLKRQHGLVDTWRDNGARGTILAATGFGKTTVALIAIQRFRKQFSGKIVVVVPTLYLRDQWGLRIQAWGIKNIEVWVINSLVKNEFDCELLILDEIHGYTAPVFSRAFLCVKYKFILGLTATLRDDEQKNAIIHKNCPVIARVPLEECLENGWVSPFVIYNYGVSMTDHEAEKYKKLSTNFGKYFAPFNHNLNFAFTCLKNKSQRYALSAQIGWSEQKIRVYAVNFVRIMKKRKAFLYSLESKLETAAEIIRKFPDRKILTFSQLIEAATTLTEMVGDNVAISYHSRMGKTVRKKAIDMYRNGFFRVINTATALDHGADLPEVDFSIITSGTSKILQDQQRRGRVIRAGLGKFSVIVEIYALKTQDEKWLKSRQEGVSRETIRWIRSVDEIVLPEVVTPLTS